MADLAARLAELDRSYTLSTLSRIEQGKRRVDIEDLVAIASALDVSANSILFPPDEQDEGETQLTPKMGTGPPEPSPWPVSDDASSVADIPVAAGSVRWERPTARSFWNALADPEREALAAAGVEEVFRAGAVLCRAGDDTSQVMIIDSGWAKVSVRDGGRRRRSWPCAARGTWWASGPR